MNLVSRPHVQNFIDWCKDKPEVLVLTADLSNSCEVGKWRETYPERFFPMGMAEQNMMGMAAGLAREGFTPFIHTFAVFIYRRPYDQLAMSIAYPNLKVRMMAFLPGIVTPGGVTHQAIEDVAIMRATPNMTIFDTGDATEVESVLDIAQAVDGPVYVRLLRGDMPRLFPKDEPMQFNKARVLSTGDDITVLTSSIITEEALRAVNVLKSKGVSVNHLHISTLKPFTDPLVVEAINRAKYGVITMENHSIVGGLGSAVAEVIADNAIHRPLLRLGLKDTYAHGASKNFLMEEYELDAIALVRGVEKLLKRNLSIEKSDLEQARIDDMNASSKVEAL
ncbi:transketolase [Glaciecola punicea ACAM 611]|uniref:Transketolase n=1 Tax=Glaciecola punicea ACAM 611 TaxID=1121923 RepID=H5T8N1_9ALTE|nr:transketolase C-terminal domain-containing protein [Glaciecola punicea]OFA29935.1 transketolase [Glaciecola punicea]GAB54507.1 transketolase [Glaciecola punicea ACAM 611]